jgi:hypothetical protein
MAWSHVRKKPHMARHAGLIWRRESLLRSLETLYNPNFFDLYFESYQQKYQRIGLIRFPCRSIAFIQRGLSSKLGYQAPLLIHGSRD